MRRIAPLRSRRAGRRLGSLPVDQTRAPFGFVFNPFRFDDGPEPSMEQLRLLGLGIEGHAIQVDLHQEKTKRMDGFDHSENGQDQPA